MVEALPLEEEPEAELAVSAIAGEPSDRGNEREGYEHRAQCPDNRVEGDHESIRWMAIPSSTPSRNHPAGGTSRTYVTSISNASRSSPSAVFTSTWQVPV